MAHLLLSRALLRHQSPPTPFLLPLRRHSSKPASGYLIEIDLSSSSAASANTPPSVDDDGEAGLKKTAAMLAQLQDLFSQFALLRSTPSWLPFLPGSSFWVPPEHRPRSVSEMVDEWSNRPTPEESNSLTTTRGFPSASFYLSDVSSRKPDPKARFEFTVLRREPTPDSNFLAWARYGFEVAEPEEDEDDGEINSSVIKSDKSLKEG